MYEITHTSGQFYGFTVQKEILYITFGAFDSRPLFLTAYLMLTALVHIDLTAARVFLPPKESKFDT